MARKKMIPFPYRDVSELTLEEQIEQRMRLDYEFDDMPPSTMQNPNTGEWIDTGVRYRM